jgi:DNA (cytosine-5)-methyltransferase 1
MKYFSLFSGIGAFEKALKNLAVDFELVGYCEIDKYASKSYSAIHDVPESMNYGDITKIDESQLPDDIDLITYGFPCQDISLAGKQKGLFNEDGSQTRSGLFFEALRIIEATKPKIAIAENVKNLTSKKFNAQLQIVLASLDAAGYNNYYQVLNAKDYGVPQNRERVFIVSIRKDIDTGSFKFPEPFTLKLRLKDVLESEVDKKYYLGEKRLQIIKQNLGEVFNDNFVIGSSQKNAFVGDDSVYPSLTNAMGAGGGQTPMVKQIGNCCPTKTRDNPNQGRIYDADGLAPTLNQMEGGNRQPFIVQKVGNIYPSGGQNGNVYSTDGISPTILSGETNTKGNGGIGSNNAPKIAVHGTIVDDTQGFDGVRYYEGYSPALRASRSGLKTVDSDLRIRKLTPKECFRLMGFGDADFEKAEAVNSNTQLYKQAGNSIVVDVLEHLIQELLNCGALEGDNT